jgi:hypothetical protein
MCLNFGAKFQFYDPIGKQVWWPTHTPDFIQYSGIKYIGKLKKFPIFYGEKPMSDPDITGTNLEPVYQTRVDSMTQIYLPLPKGVYQLTAHYSLLAEDLKTDNILYIREMGSTIVRSKTTLTSADINKAVKSSFDIEVQDKGITLQTVSSKGNFVLNGLVIKKIE